MNNSILNDYEKENGIKIPEILKIHFLFNIPGLLFHEFRNSKSGEFSFPLSLLSFQDKNGENLYVDSMLSSIDLRSKLETFKIMWGDEMTKVFFPLSYGVFPKHQWLLMGVSESNYGQIWLSDEGGGRDCSKLFSSLFEFYTKSKISYRNELLGRNELGDLYRNWGESFWRVKGDEGELS